MTSSLLPVLLGVGGTIVGMILSFQELESGSNDMGSLSASTSGVLWSTALGVGLFLILFTLGFISLCIWAVSAVQSAREPSKAEESEGTSES